MFGGAKNNKIWNDLTYACQVVRWQVHPPPTSIVDPRWSKPSIDMYKCDVDTSFSSGLNKLCVDICISEDRGAFLSLQT